MCSIETAMKMWIVVNLPIEANSEGAYFILRSARYGVIREMTLGAFQTPSDSFMEETTKNAALNRELQVLEELEDDEED